MNEQHLIQLLQKAKNAPEFGGGFDESQSQKVWLRICDDLGFADQAPKKSYSFFDYLEYWRSNIPHVVLRPVALAASICALIVSGWVTTVNASFDSVPGDVLYPVKLATERLQLSLTATSNRRAKLHTEFAGRRLQEINQVRDSSHTDKEERVKVAVESFKKELASANDDLNAAKDNSEDATGLAIEIDQRTDEYKTLLARTQEVSSQDEKAVIESAQQAVEEAGVKVIDTLVESNESGENEVSGDALKQNFREDYNSLKKRISLTLGRLVVIDTALKSRSDLVRVDWQETVIDTRQLVLLQEEPLNAAMNIMGAGGYRGAFDLLETIKTQVKKAEEAITQIEVEISTLN